MGLYRFFNNYQGFIYTIDMLRLKTLLSPTDAKELRKLLNTYLVKYWNGFGYDKFAENWKVDAIWLGLGTKVKPKNNGDFDINEKINFTIEFNPNKMTDNDIFIYNLLIKSYKFNVIRFDLAVDIPHNINNLVFLDICKKCYSIFYNDFNNKTYYIGKGNRTYKNI